MSTYIGKVQIGTDDRNRASIGSTLYGICTTSASTAEKIVILPEFDTIIHGVTVFVRFTEGNSATSNVKLAVNNKGNYSVFGNCTCKANSVIGFTFDEATGLTSAEATGLTSASPFAHAISNSDTDYYWRVVNPTDIIASTNSSLGSVSINVNGVDVATGLAPTANPIFTGTVTIPATTSASGDNTAATKKYVDTAISTGMAGVSSMVFKGTIGPGGTINTTAEPPQTLPKSGYLTGETYYVIQRGQYAGQWCETGDLIIAIHDGPNTAGESVIDEDWTIAQTNIDGAVVTSGDNNIGKIAIFNDNNSISGQIAITSSGDGFLKEDGTWDTPLDTKVLQSPYTNTTSAEFNLLFKYTSGDDEETAGVHYSTIASKKITFNPATGIVSAAGFSGLLNTTNLNGIDGTSSGLTFLHQSGHWETLSLSTGSGTNVIIEATATGGVLTLTPGTITLSAVS